MTLCLHVDRLIANLLQLIRKRGIKERTKYRNIGPTNSDENGTREKKYWAKKETKTEESVHVGKALIIIGGIIRE